MGKNETKSKNKKKNLQLTNVISYIKAFKYM